MAKTSGTLKDDLINQHSPYKHWANYELKQTGGSIASVGLMWHLC